MEKRDVASWTAEVSTCHNLTLHDDTPDTAVDYNNKGWTILQVEHARFITVSFFSDKTVT